MRRVLVAELSRWCKPPVAGSKSRQPRQGRGIKGSVHQILRRCDVTIPDTPRETYALMVLRLSLDVLADRFPMGSAHRECAVTFLPCETTHPNLIVHPTRRNRFKLAHNISQTVRRAKANQQMHMIGNSADALGDSIRRANDSAKISVQVCPP